MSSERIWWRFIRRRIVSYDWGIWCMWRRWYWKGWVCWYLFWIMELNIDWMISLLFYWVEMNDFILSDGVWELVWILYFWRYCIRIIEFYMIIFYLLFLWMYVIFCNFGFWCSLMVFVSLFCFFDKCFKEVIWGRMILE